MSSSRGGRAGARRRKRNAHRWKLSVLLIFLVAGLATAGITVTVKVLFKIAVIAVNGKTIYSNAQIVEASGIRTGGSLFGVDTTRAGRQICRSLPYIKTAKVELVPFSTVQISVTPETAAEKVPLDNGFAVVGGDLKVLETGAGRAAWNALPTVVGVKAKAADPGSGLQAAEGQLSALTAINQACAVDNISLTEFTKIDVTDMYEISLLYGGKINVLTGTSTNMGYKLKVAAYILQKKKGAAGTLDVSTAEPDSPDAYKIYFDPA